MCAKEFETVKIVRWPAQPTQSALLPSNCQGLVCNPWIRFVGGPLNPCQRTGSWKRCKKQQQILPKLHHLVVYLAYFCIYPEGLGVPKFSRIAENQSWDLAKLRCETGPCPNLGSYAVGSVEFGWPCCHQRQAAGAAPQIAEDSGIDDSQLKTMKKFEFAVWRLLQKLHAMLGEWARTSLCACVCVWLFVVEPWFCSKHARAHSLPSSSKYSLQIPVVYFPVTFLCILMSRLWWWLFRWTSAGSQQHQPRKSPAKLDWVLSREQTYPLYLWKKNIGIR